MKSNYFGFEVSGEREDDDALTLADGRRNGKKAAYGPRPYEWFGSFPRVGRGGKEFCD